MEEYMTTKERILEEALTLFSENGYNGTGVDLIAERVGIKGPSLYKHFKGKEDILNSLIDAAEARYEEMFGSERNIGKIPECREEFVQTTLGRISFTMKDPMIRKIRKLLIQEQFRSQRLAEVTTRHQQDGIQAMFDLAQNAGKGPQTLREIAERQDISEEYLEQIAGVLRRAGFVASVRGAQGGYRLARDASGITLGELIRTLEGPIFSRNASQSAKHAPAATAVPPGCSGNGWKKASTKWWTVSRFRTWQTILPAHRRAGGRSRRWNAFIWITLRRHRSSRKCLRRCCPGLRSTTETR